MGSDPAPLARYRRAGTVVYLVFTFGAGIWVTASVLAGLLHERPVARQRPPIDRDSRAQLLGCEQDLTGLLTDLHRKAFAVQNKAVEQELDVGRDWDGFVERWRERWTEVGRHCRLADPGAEPALERMADVHGQLDELAVAYRGLLLSFQDRYMDRLRTLRRSLAEIRHLLRARRGASRES